MDSLSQCIVNLHGILAEHNGIQIGQLQLVHTIILPTRYSYMKIIPCFLNLRWFELQDGRFRANRDSRKGRPCLFSYTAVDQDASIWKRIILIISCAVQVGRKVAKEKVVVAAGADEAVVYVE